MLGALQKTEDNTGHDEFGIRDPGPAPGCFSRTDRTTLASWTDGPMGGGFVS